MTDDYLIRATAADGMIRAFALTSRNTVEKARQIHGTSPVAGAALGRLMSAALMMGADMKNEKDLITMRILGDGPLRSVLVTADNAGHVKGYVGNPSFVNPANYLGKFDVGGAIGNGSLSVIKDIGLKEPYIGQTMLVTGEIAEDLAYYFATSEQIPTAVSLGVLMTQENTVREAGGFILQLMPGADDDIAAELEKKVGDLPNITTMLSSGMLPEDILEKALSGFGCEINAKMPVGYRCDCTRERVAKALISVGRKDLEEMVNDGKPVELSCHFCNKKYSFSTEEIKNLIR